MTTLTMYTPEGMTLLDTAGTDYKGWHMFVVDRLGGSGANQQPFILTVI